MITGHIMKTTEKQRQQAKEYYYRNREKVNVRTRKWYHDNKEYASAKSKTYRRNHVIVQVKKNIYGVNKAPYPSDGLCQGCGAHPSYLAYHHYDNSDYSDGNYLCNYCHNGIEGITKGNLLRAIVMDRFKKGKPPFCGGPPCSL